MPSYSKNSIILVQYPFSDLTSAKVRPAIVVNASHPSQDCLIVPLTSRTTNLLPGEFVLSDWKAARLNIASAVKRGIYTVHQELIIKRIGPLSTRDSEQLDLALRLWLDL
jgi:mRNA interferase MazF